MKIEINMGEITPETKLKLTMRDVVGIIVFCAITFCTVAMYMGWIPVKGSEDNTINFTGEVATKEYVAANYASREKLNDSINALQIQINLLTVTLNEIKSGQSIQSSDIKEILKRLK